MSGNNTELKISGFGEAPGGSYSTVRINGGGKITGDVICSGEFVTNGSGDVAGSVQSASLHVNGTGRFMGDVKTQKFKIHGTADIHGTTECTDLTVTGTADFINSVKAQSVKISGSARMKTDCTAERFESSGLFEVDGLLNADHIDIHLHWSKSRAGEVGGDYIMVRHGSKGLNALRQIFSINPHFEAKSIEGTDINLESTKASVVRGRNVTIGNGCDIALVEYTGTLRKTGSARVGEERKV